VPRKQKADRPSHGRPTENGPGVETELRIIGGEFRGRRLRYHGDPIVRPMKHRVREAIFNLITTDGPGRQAFDLFAGTGALGLEALSRGAAHATLIEKHVPTARVVEENIRTLGVEDRTTLLVTSAFLWGKRDLPGRSQEQRDKRQEPEVDSVESHKGEPPALDSRRSALDSPWLVFCSPPYSFFTERQEEMLDLIRRIQEHAPSGSVIVVESDESFDFDLLRTASSGNTTDAGRARETSDGWNIRAYSPAVVGIWRK
jgi:16S rRNA (guanine966-N2)-methyltransferase